MTTYTITGTSHPNTPWEENINFTGTLEDIAKEIFDDYLRYCPHLDGLQSEYPDHYLYFYPYEDNEGGEDATPSALPNFTENVILTMASIAYDMPAKHLTLTPLN